MAVLEVKDLEISYHDKPLVSNISFSIDSGKCTAIIGESGSGKSITSSAIGRILPGKLEVTNGSITLNGRDVLGMSKTELREMRGTQVSYIFQDYQSAFTPFIKVGKQFHETINCHVKMDKAKQKELILSKIESVGLDAKRVYNSYPFQLSGGQLQRCAIAQAMLLDPVLLVADEPTTALDSVSTANVLELIQGIKKDANCAILFITHDLRTVKKYADELVIMYKGHIVERGGKDEVIANPKHIYTKNLFASVPPLRDVPDRLPVLEIPDDTDLNEIGGGTDGN